MILHYIHGQFQQRPFAANRDRFHNSSGRLEPGWFNFGRSYCVERKLGEGGIGDVYLARDKPELMARQVVVKVLQEKALNNEWIVTKFRQEIEALTRIDDPGVVGLLDAGTLPDGHPFLVMQFVEGENLRAHMRLDGGMAVLETLPTSCSRSEVR